MRLRFILEPFRTSILVQEVMVATILNGITGGICIAALLDEFTYRPVTVDSRRGSTLAQACITFGPMNPHEPIFVAPSITEIPDYVWSPRYDRPSWIPGRPVKKPKDTSKRIPHPNAESALKAAKKSCRGNTGRWFGRAPEGPTAFWVYEGNKVVERHVVIGPPIGPHPPIG